MEFVRTSLTEEERVQSIKKLGAADEDMNALLEFTKNVFIPRQYGEDNQPPQDELSLKWPDIWAKAQALCQTPPRLEMFGSAAGTIPIIYPGSTADYEKLLREIVYKGKEVAHIERMGASFVHGKTLRFIILSNKPYSGVTAEDMGLTESDWQTKSMTIRKHHECTHYYTKRFLGASRNHPHDELIADFCGLYAAFGEYNAELFMMFYDIRSAIYTKGLSPAAAAAIHSLMAAAAAGVENWTNTDGFKQMGEAGRIDYLANKELLEYIK